MLSSSSAHESFPISEKGIAHFKDNNTLSDADNEWTSVATTVLRKDGYAISSLKHPREKLVESSLRFLQLLCENHNLEMQVSYDDYGIS